MSLALTAWIPLEIAKVCFTVRDTNYIFKKMLTNLNAMNGNAFNVQHKVEKIIFNVLIETFSKRRTLGVSYL